VTRLLRAALGGLPEPDTDSAAAMARRAADVLRPPGALAALDDLAIHLAAWQGTTQPAVRHPAVLVFAGDHGVADAGVSNYPADITTAILAAIRAGRATVHAMARAAGATVEAVDVGVGVPTGDIRFEAALSEERFEDVPRVVRRPLARARTAQHLRSSCTGCLESPRVSSRARRPRR